MSVKQAKIPIKSAAVSDSSGVPEEMIPEPHARNPRQDFVFAVKLFGITGLVIFLIWLMNRAVS